MVDKEKYIHVLESFKKRKGMYIATEELESALIFLSGFICAVVSQTPERQYPNDFINDIGLKRGWKKSACGPIFRIEQSDLPVDEKINELVDIYIECIRILIADEEQKNA